MNAEQSREQTKRAIPEVRKLVLEHILNEIAEQSNIGRFDLLYYKLGDDLVEDLEALGYDVWYSWWTEVSTVSWK